MEDIFALCSGVEVVGMTLVLLSRLTASDGQGRDPFPFTSERGCTLDKNEQWLLLANEMQANWQIGDNVVYPCRALRIRKVYPLMKKFIVNQIAQKSNVSSSLFEANTTRR